MKFERQKLWNQGKVIDHHEDNTQCSRYGCRAHVGVREFDFGFFCREHFIEAPECITPGCSNPAIIERKPDGDPRCRLCQFDYEGELEVYLESNLARAKVFGMSGFNMRERLRKSMKRNGIPTDDNWNHQSHNSWFPRGIEEEVERRR